MDPDGLLYDVGASVALGLYGAVLYAVFYVLRAAARSAWRRTVAAMPSPDTDAAAGISGTPPRTWPTALWKEKRIRQRIWNASRVPPPPEDPPIDGASPAPMLVPVVPPRSPVLTGRRAEPIPERYLIDGVESP